MILFDLLQLWNPSFRAESTKVHLARYNGIEKPLDVFIQGNFDEWQCWQGRRNFQRNFVVSLIQAGSPTSWLFAGLFRVDGYEKRDLPTPHYFYDLYRIPETEEWVGRMYLTSQYKDRNSYPNGETLSKDLVVSEVLATRLSIGQFPGFKNINLTKGQLDVVMRENIDSWRSALSSVKGIYLITDTKTGKLYVGKADGEDGIWGRWAVYSSTAHGHNVALMQEFGVNAIPARNSDLRFSVLEIADLHTMQKDIANRENHWKEVLMSRVHGFNRN